MDALFLQSLEGLEDPPLVPTGGEVWKSWQAKKQHVAYEIRSDCPLCLTAKVGGGKPTLRKEIGRQGNGSAAGNWQRGCEISNRTNR